MSLNVQFQPLLYGTTCSNLQFCALKKAIYGGVKR